jgi:glycosyltransferase involved in cell wall biosynthesis
MKVVLITPVTPYKENMGGPSGHPYHLMIERPEGIDIIIYSYNNNHLSDSVIREVEKELRVEVRLLQQPKWWLMILRLHLTFIRLFLKYPINYFIRLDKSDVEEIKSLKPDLIWGYCQEFSGILKQFKDYRRLHTVPDCYSLHFYRRLGRRQTLADVKEYWRVVTNYFKHYRMERDYDDSENIFYHLVGEEDKKFLLEINPKLNAHFIRHPLYKDNVNDNHNVNKRRFHQPKIKVLIAGRYDLYMKQEADLLVESLTSLTPNPSPKGEGNREREGNSIHPSGGDLRGAYTFTFLGKGWEKHVERMRQAGFEVEHITFAPDYIEEISKHDIQITPIAIGTGTKGKVLDALANGLLVIGTPYAMENIAVKHGESCVEYEKPQEVIDILKEIPLNKERYEAMAREGQRQVLKWHDRSLIAKELFANTNH